MGKSSKNKLKVCLAQLTPVWLKRDATLERVAEAMAEAAAEGAELIVFPEAFCPGYPFWLAYTEGASWEKPVNKELHAHYMQEAVCLESGHLDGICEQAKSLGLAVYLGIVERPLDRGGHSLYCSLVYIDSRGTIASVHRKLQPTYDERLCWAPGDGNGLQAHDLKGFRLGGLNCWENWMPLARASLYALGTNVHIAVWPGSDYNTREITRFIARESRSYVLSVSSVMARKDLPLELPHRDLILEKGPEEYANGGSCLAGPDAEWVLEPQIGAVGLFYAELSLEAVYQERQNFDPSGHYSRPDVTRLRVNRERQGIVNPEEDK